MLQSTKHQFRIMQRRSFIKKNTAAALASGLGSLAWAAESTTNSPTPFNLNYAPHFGMFKQTAGEDLMSQLDFMAEVGFRGLEDNEMRNRDKSVQQNIANRMEKHGMEMGVFVAHTIFWHQPSLSSGEAGKRAQFLSEIKSSVEVAKRVNAKWMTVVPGHVDPKQDMGYQTAHLIETLKQACAILEPHGLVMVLEPLNFRDHPGLILTKIPQAYAICKAVDSPSCKILNDLYHQQITEGNLLPNIDLAWDEIAYFQVGDNPGRKEPTSGEINYLNVFRHIHNKGFKGIVGMEHGNSQAGQAGEQHVIDAYRQVDRF